MTKIKGFWDGLTPFERALVEAEIRKIRVQQQKSRQGIIGRIRALIRGDK